ncbi:exodeoxyribonuclease 7 large subunit [Phycisphaerae bacterium]|nr:exodeoxyribonuclease 7 large subunit [Phycisphaerae bacterium]
MARKPFDPSLAAGGLFDKPASPLPAKEEPKAPEALRVSDLSLLIRNALEGGVGTVRVIGEMSNFRSVQGHWYFSLKDANARIDCMMFRSAADRSSCKPTDGIEVIVTGQVTHYPPQGRTQIQCAKVELAGAGDLDAQFRQLCLELRELGYFDDSAKVKIPAMPMCIALLTSAGSAAEADCLDAARQTFPSTKIIAVDIRVQGAQAAQGIANAIAAVDASAKRLGIEVILLVRGGGSREDLWAFNERVVADAIRRCVTPIVTGIGHEIDTTIADLVADFRAATPSRAVTEILPKREILQEQLAALTRRLSRAMTTHFERARGRVELAARSRGLMDPLTGLTIHHNRLMRSATALVHAMRQRTNRREQLLAGALARLAQVHPMSRLKTADAKILAASASLRRSGQTLVDAADRRIESVSRTLEAIGPMAVLQRGYSLTLNSSGTPVRSAESLRVGESIESVFADGQVGSVVDRIVPSKSTSAIPTKPSDGGSLDSTP